MAAPLRMLVVAVALTGTLCVCIVLLAGSVVLGIPAPPTTAAIRQVPPAMLTLYQQAAPTCPGLSWTVLAAIGTVESSNGTSQLPGVRSGANFAGARGPMQFEPSTFAAYDEPVPPGGADPPSPYDPVDAVYAAARLLCANGAAGGRDVAGAIFSYNHSQDYVREVMSIAGNYAQDGGGS